VLCDADDVICEMVYGSDSEGQTGRLFVTNFKIIFLRAADSELQDEVSFGIVIIK